LKGVVVAAPRTFEKSLPDLPGVPILDWELLNRLQDLFGPYLPSATPETQWLFRAHDNRGEYVARSVTELREEAEAQEEPPDSVRLFVASDNSLHAGPWYELGVTVRMDGSHGLLLSSDEQIVNHVSTRLRELFGQAARRSETTVKHAPNGRGDAEPAALAPRQQTAPSGSFWTKHLTEFAVGATATVVGGLILYFLIGG
jgi:hypothetical protein